eukprot:CAMPEP_0117443038 /NCGR_PEP_ID=MMETSP0759-20121206/4479_1 /TAXON_ID=63605 /ORGANISM="Percolomonas cosmopolitus, Strain WS" /LENGTH=347 /DNA_ID=CAMNT_0005234981 /DNA_START=16 /DNA_END=1056 /DNA_ORIENTATION=-
MTSNQTAQSNTNPHTDFLPLKTLHSHTRFTPQHVFITRDHKASSASGKIKEFLQKNKVQRLKMQPVPLPIQFDNTEHKINFWCWKNLLDFGSGYQIYLKESVGRVMLYGLVHLVLSGKSLNAQDMMDLDDFAISQTFRIDLTKEVPHETLTGVRVDQDLPTKKLVQLMKRVLHDAARKLQEYQCEDFASFLYMHLKRNNTCGSLMKALTSEFEGFKDEYDVKIGKDTTEKLPINSKVQSLLKELYTNVANDDEMFRFPDIEQLTVCISGPIPAILNRLNLIEYSPELQQRIADRRPFRYGSQEEFEIRKMSLEICEMIVEASKGQVRGVDLDHHLYKLAKAVQKDDL